MHCFRFYRADLEESSHLGLFFELCSLCFVLCPVSERKESERHE
jgi:hypothetical protein